MPLSDKIFREMNWHTVVFDVEQLSARLGVRLILDFQACVQRAGLPPGLCLFEIKGEQQSTLWTFYFPPAVERYCPELLEKYGAVRTTAPLREKLQVAVGVPLSIEHIFKQAEAPDDFTGL